MTQPLLFRTLAAGFVCIVLAGGLVWNYERQRTQWSVLFTGDPQRGSELFYGKKLCARCHSVNGQGSRVAPDLGALGDSHASLSQVVVAMWNHAPRMMARLQAEGIQVPEMSRQEMADILVFLYTERAVDEQGDPEPSTGTTATPTAATAATRGRRPHTPPTLQADGASSTPAPRTLSRSSPTANSCSGTTITAARPCTTRSGITISTATPPGSAAAWKGTD